MDSTSDSSNPGWVARHHPGDPYLPEDVRRKAVFMILTGERSSY